MKAVIIFLLTAFGAYNCFAQAGINLDLNAPGIGGYGNISFTNATTLGAKPVDAVDDADVAGSPYFDAKWRKAVLILQNNQALRVNKVKLNLYKGEVHYIDTTGIELVAFAGAVKKIFFMDAQDSTKIGAVFQQIVGLDAKVGSSFIQVLNSGKAELLKLITVSLNNKGFDPVSGKNNYGFLAKNSYYLLNDGMVKPLKNLNGSAVLEVITPSEKEKTWLANNDNKLKNEKDIVSFLSFYNDSK